MTNPWIEHVRKYAKDNNISYACAISKASDTYTKKTKTSAKQTNLKLVELLKTLTGDDMIFLFTPTKRKSSYDLAGDRDVVIKKLLERFATTSDRQKVYDRVIKYKNKK